MKGNVIKIGVDSWTRTPQEQRWRSRAKAHEASKGDRAPLQERAADAVKRRWAGEQLCDCGCRQTATAFRGGKMYNSKCVGPGSGWSKSVLPNDRTPPRNHGGNRWWPNS